MSQSGYNVNVEQDVRALAGEILEMEPEKIRSDANFVKDLGMDSMMALELLAGIEKKYRIIIPEEGLSQFTDINTAVRLVQGILEKGKAT